MKLTTFNTESDPDVDIIVNAKFNGDVWIGDPCYVIPNKDWSKFVDLSFELGSEGVIKTPHGIVFIWDTKHGDGEYPVYVGTKEDEVGTCGVDSGMLCVMYYETARKMFKNERNFGVSERLLKTSVGFAKCLTTTSRWEILA